MTELWDCVINICCPYWRSMMANPNLTSSVLCDLRRDTWLNGRVEGGKEAVSSWNQLWGVGDKVLRGSTTQAAVSIPMKRQSELFLSKATLNLCCMLSWPSVWPVFAPSG